MVIAKCFHPNLNINEICILIILEETMNFNYQNVKKTHLGLVQEVTSSFPPWYDLAIVCFGIKLQWPTHSLVKSAYVLISLSVYIHCSIYPWGSHYHIFATILIWIPMQKRTKIQTMIYKILHRKLKTEQHKTHTHKKPGSEHYNFWIDDLLPSRERIKCDWWLITYYHLI